MTATTGPSHAFAYAMCPMHIIHQRMILRFLHRRLAALMGSSTSRSAVNSSGVSTAGKPVMIFLTLRPQATNMTALIEHEEVCVRVALLLATGEFLLVLGIGRSVPSCQKGGEEGTSLARLVAKRVVHSSAVRAGKRSWCAQARFNGAGEKIRRSTHASKSLLGHRFVVSGPPTRRFFRCRHGLPSVESLSDDVRAGIMCRCLRASGLTLQGVGS
jgi:hypothetical protein